jgi:toxin-antitoxin system PIN domain toxin
VIYLLDVNLLIALCDDHHTHHDAASAWFESEKVRRWATCPLTQNGFVRITSKSNYPGGHGTVSEQLKTLAELCRLPHHVFWPDEISLLRTQIWTGIDLVNPSHLTDLYLLALAVERGGKLATLDRRIPAHFIRGGNQALHLVAG